ncbi:MAG: hypothetical protein QG578_1092 [Thermodesulfobacteriota bacterium]|nr:hypothetical protein [Thermodesulfobacteriota bacterium]
MQSDHFVTAILTTGFILVVITFLTSIFFLIYSFIQIKKAANAITAFLAATELKINPVLKEAEETLKSIRTVSDDIGSVTSSLKCISGTISELAFKIKTLGLLTDGIHNQLSVRVSALKAGIKAATGVLFNQEKKGEP